jgi:hypothetical protein
MISDDGRELCFIVGHYKSGSTWLTNLLSLHPDIRGVSETHVFRYAASSPDFVSCTKQIFRYGAWAEGGMRRFVRHRIAEWSRPARAMFALAKGQSALPATERPTTRLDLSLLDQLRMQGRLNKSTSSEQYCRTFFEFLHSRLRPARYLAEKTPTNINYIPAIKQIFPSAKLVAIYRDGRDVVVSDKYYSALEYGRNVRLNDSTLKWRSAMEAQLKYTPEFGIHCLSYESLLARPHEVVDMLLEYLELTASKTVVDDMIARSSFEFVTGRTRGTARNEFYRKGVAADWANHFTEADMRQFSELAGDLLVSLGYEQSSDPLTWKADGALLGERLLRQPT